MYGRVVHRDLRPWGGGHLHAGRGCVGLLRGWTELCPRGERQPLLQLLGRNMYAIHSGIDGLLREPRLQKQPLRLLHHGRPYLPFQRGVLLGPLLGRLMRSLRVDDLYCGAPRNHLASPCRSGANCPHVVDGADDVHT